MNKLYKTPVFIVIIILCIISVSLLILTKSNSYGEEYKIERFSIDFPNEPQKRQVNIVDKGWNIAIINYQSTDEIGLYTLSFGKISPSLNVAQQKDFMENLFFELS